MLSAILKSLMIIVLAAIIFLGGYLLWLNYEPERELNWLMERFATEAAATVSEDLPRDPDVNRVLLVPVVGTYDEGRQLTRIIGDAAKEQNKFNVVTWEDAVDTGGEEFSTQFGDRKNAPPDVNGARLAAEYLNENHTGRIQAVLRIILEDFTDGQNKSNPRLVFRTELVRLSTGEEIFGDDYSREVGSMHPMVIAFKVGNTSFILRMLFWLAVAIAIPFALWGSGIAKVILSKRQNKYNLSLLIAMTAVSTVLVWFLLGMYLGFFGWVTVLLMTAAAAYYNYDALNFFQTRV